MNLFIEIVLNCIFKFLQVFVGFGIGWALGSLLLKFYNKVVKK